MTSGGRSTVSIALKNVLNALCEWRPYLGMWLPWTALDLVFDFVSLVRLRALFRSVQPLTWDRYAVIPASEEGT